VSDTLFLRRVAIYQYTFSMARENYEKQTNPEIKCY
jgi:hypothetical protein